MKRIIDSKTVDGVFKKDVSYETEMVLEKIAVDFVNNRDRSLIDFYSDIKYPKISLPTYPCQGEQYTVIKQKWRGRIDNILEKYNLIINDHIVCGDKIVPGILWVDLSREFFGLYDYTLEVCGLLNIYPQLEFINIKCDKQASVSKIEVSFTGNDMIYANLIFIKNMGISCVDKNDIKLQIRRLHNILNKEDVYDYIRELGILYGKSFRIMEKLHIIDENEVIAEIEDQSCAEYVMSIIDASFQVTAFFDKCYTYLPARIEHLTICSDLLASKYLYVEKRNQYFSICFFSSE